MMLLAVMHAKMTAFDPKRRIMSGPKINLCVRLTLQAFMVNDRKNAPAKSVHTDSRKKLNGEVLAYGRRMRMRCRYLSLQRAPDDRALLSLPLVPTGNR